ncbi:MAG: YciK family oxidoreductase [Candidatus Competibacteraceae bacterium]|uniref:Oxoacyl-(Acyl carrier protein) reductase with NAD(P)-binding domain n=1 Tax=Candidatus Contendobacter odensis Run_B_J11 TaxID=1400861 RepID=A0A7U7GCB1_9GAMM|nr:YciK family oxidoreductase [Candidatus Contendobacter odensis]MBK8534224.1 YciK family oxidoreductase [Candidatus Competibacteraceae bacterium]MBK8752000.1 YciK family oxidoreductase [Candidatus Competibacteraceae bacterium]CDH45803.1 putative oxoacyl-(acyl carrier protein) reductase with NAD(P)-binding domain [Candidatus Contendobacter odensis Run_B_J11]
MKDYQPAADLLKNRVILITGIGEGIGRAAARRLAGYGATVILLGRTIRKLEQVYDDIEQAGGPKPAIYPMNLEGATPKDYADLARVLDTEFGRLDGVLHNAALFAGLTPIANYDIELWYRILQVNLNAPFLLTQAVLELLSRSSDASVVFTTDQVGEEGRAYWGAYAVAKGGAQTLMKLLASELETNTNIRVNSIDPGQVRSELTLRAYPGRDPAEWADPEDIMATYLYLLGPDSKGVTGQTFRAQD